MLEGKNTKMVIVIRKDLKMRTGKACTQASQASMAFLTDGMFSYGPHKDEKFEGITDHLSLL